MLRKGFVFRVIISSLLAAYAMLLITPTQLKAKAAVIAPESKAECVMELNSRRVLYQAHGDTRLPMASTTKVVTCITVLELCSDLDKQIAIPKEAVGIEGSSVYLKEGELYSIKDLLYGLMLRSGNDCATALALHCSGTVAKFTTEMNKIAQRAGALNSNFENPHGLPCDGHYTTAYDLALITCYAMQNPVFCEIVGTKNYNARHWKNKNKMLALYEGGIGVKTGYTKEAGRCLVSAAKREDMTLVCVVLSSPMTYERSAKLMDDAFALYKRVCLLGETEELQIEGTKIKGTAKKAYYYPLIEEEKEVVEIHTQAAKNYDKRKKEGEIVGKFEIYLAKRLLFSGNLYKLE